MNQGQTRRTVLAFMAHPDDAEILCAGTLIRLADLGWEVHIATATAGDCGSATMGPEEISNIRRREAAESAHRISGHYHCLEQRDVLVTYDQPTIRRTVDLFREIAPSLVFTHPRQDYMMDHEQVHMLARSAAFGYAVPNASALPLVEGSVVPHLYYCDPVEGVDMLGREAEATTLVDVTEQMERKAQMLACHASQRDWLRAHHGMDEYIDAMRRHGRQRGERAGCEFAEAFTQHRGHAFPRNDLLGELFGKD